MRKIILIQLVLIILLPNVFAQWSEQVISPHPPKLNCVSVYIDEGWIGGDSGIIYYTSNDGTNWFMRNDPIVFGINNVNVIQCVKSGSWTFGKALCSANSATATYIYRSSDQGVNWSIVYQQPNGRIRSIVILDTATGFAIGDPVGGRWTILKTTNAGLTFDSSGLYLAQNGGEFSSYNSAYYAMGIYNNNTYLMYGTNNSRIYRSTNNGINWSSIVLPFQNVYTICLASSGFSYYAMPNRCLEWGYACGNGADTTHSFGQSWNSMNLPGTGDIRTLYCDGGYTCYAKGSQIYGSPNLFSPFTLNYKSPNGGNYTQISMMYLIGVEAGARLGWAVKDNGTVSRYQLTWGGVKKISSEIPGKYSLSQNYPNPFNPTTKIRFDIRSPQSGKEETPISLKIYDILGKEMAILVNERLKPGSYEIEWNGTNYSSGVYWYKLSWGNLPANSGQGYTVTKKMVLLK